VAYSQHVVSESGTDFVSLHLNFLIAFLLTTAQQQLNDKKVVSLECVYTGHKFVAQHHMDVIGVGVILALVACNRRRRKRQSWIHPIYKCFIGFQLGNFIQVFNATGITPISSSHIIE
jgi:hypothetical protein